MKQEIRDAWVDALRSGNYKQGKYALNNKGRFCCLGVLNDVMGNASKPDGNTGTSYFDSKFCGYEQYLTSHNPSWLEEQGVPLGLQYALIALNDKGITFDEIATYIENNAAVD